MSHSRQTEHYELPLYDGTDIINPLTDFNNANETIDEAIYNANQRSVQAEQTADEAKNIAEGYDARVTQAIETANSAMTLANNTQDMIADDFDPMKEGGYKVGDFVIYNGKLYRFINAHTGAWDASDVQVSPVLIEAIGEVVDEGKQAINEAVAEAEEEIAGQTEKVTKTQAMIAQPFDENKDGGYAVDDVVTYADKLYKFTSAHSGAWTGLDVEQVDVDELIASSNVIRFDLDRAATRKTLATDILNALQSRGITELTDIRDCHLKIVVNYPTMYGSTSTIYHLSQLAFDHIELLMIYTSLNSTGMIIIPHNLTISTNSDNILATQGKVVVSANSVNYLNYKDETNDAIWNNSDILNVYAEFIWR